MIIITAERQRYLDAKYFQKSKLPKGVESVAEMIQQDRDEACGRMMEASRSVKPGRGKGATALVRKLRDA